MFRTKICFDSSNSAILVEVDPGLMVKTILILEIG
jgi:hypothetical protein